MPDVKETGSLTDDQISDLDIEQLRDAYRELRERHGKLVSTHLQMLKAAGRYTGGPAPFGYRVDRDGTTLVVERREERAISIAVDLRANGLSFAAVGVELEKRGLVSRAKTRYTATQVLRMLRIARARSERAQGSRA